MISVTWQLENLPGCDAAHTWYRCEPPRADSLLLESTGALREDTLLRPTRVLAVGTAALALGLCLDTAEAARAKPRVSFSTRKVTPKTSPGGASAVATVKVISKGGAQVSQLSLRLVGAGATSGGLAMQPQSGGRWTRTFTLPANPGTKPVTLQVWADAQTSLGARSVKIGQVKVLPSPVDPSLPPPPPPI